MSRLNQIKISDYDECGQKLTKGWFKENTPPSIKGFKPPRGAPEN